MASVFGNLLRVTLFGESHGAAIGCVIDGLPAGVRIDEARLAAALERRRSGAIGTTARRETDHYELISGVSRVDGVWITNNAPLTAVFANGDVRREDYGAFSRHFRPGHADYVSYVASGGHADLSGGGHFSGRLTAPIVFAGTLAEQILAEHGVTISARLVQVGGLEVDGFVETDEVIQELIRDQQQLGDTLGSTIAVTADGIPVGLGAPFFDTLEGRIAHAMFAIPGIKGIEFGLGFAFSYARGSEVIDAWIRDAQGRIRTTENNNGGINGGISNGMPIEFSVVVKPASSIGIEQQTLHFGRDRVEPLRIGGRHDAVIGIRAVPVVQAMTALVLLDEWLRFSGRDAMTVRRAEVGPDV